MYYGEGSIWEDSNQIGGHAIGSRGLLSGGLRQNAEFLHRGEGGSGSKGCRVMSSDARALQGELRWRMRCILREGTGRVDGAGGVSRVCLIRR